MKAEFTLSEDDIKAIIAKSLPPINGVNAMPTDAQIDTDEDGRIRATVKKEALR